MCTESRLVIGPSTILFDGMYACTFQHGNFTRWGSEGVKNKFARKLTVSVLKTKSKRTKINKSLSK